jgi:Ca2+-transporting ATPase
MYSEFWHNQAPKEIESLLQTSLKNGLTEKEAFSRKKDFGSNELPKAKPLSRFKLILSQFKSPLIYILLIAGVITTLLGEVTDSFIIFGVVLLNSLIGYFQELKASNTLNELKEIIKSHSTVLRDGHFKIIESKDLVPGDIVKLSSGEKVPADGRIFESVELKINEMALTGLADRDNMAYMGTIIENGEGTMIITETGKNTEIGKINKLVQDTKEEKTPLQKKLIKFSKISAIFIFFVSLAIFIEGIITGEDFVEIFTTSVAVAVAAVPEGLPIAMTVILALGMGKILKRKGLVRKLISAETLGSTSIICSDKTATLTEGNMKVIKVSSKNEKALQLAAFLCNEGFIENPEDSKNNWIVQGDPTDKAILTYGINNIDNTQEIEKEFSLLTHLPFNNINKYLSFLFKKGKSNILFVSGAPERIIEMSSLTNLQKKEWDRELKLMACKGLRTVAIATKKTTSKEIPESFSGLSFLGILGIADPLRADAKESIHICKKAGLRTIIITGDHKLTAKSIAEELGIKTNKENIIEGFELDLLSDKELDKRLTDINVYTRVEPRHKMRIVEAWQKRGEIVAMTGDGINDAPALKKADVGVALGSGTEIAKDIADLVLLNNSFSVIVAAIEEGRSIIDNIRKVITYHLADSFTEIVLIGFSLVLGLPLPLTAIQILWVNLVEDGPAGLVLAFEPKEKDIMDRKPQGHKIPLLTREMKYLIFIIGFITDFILLGIFIYLLEMTNLSLDHIRTFIFAALTIDSFFYIFSCKSLRKNIWQINLFSNKYLLMAWLFGVIILVLSIYLPAFQSILNTVPLNLIDWLIILGLGIFELIAIELTKRHFIVKKDFE